MSALLLKLLFFTHAYYIVKTKLLVRKTGSTIATVSCTSEVLADQSLSRVAKPPGSCVMYTCYQKGVMVMGVWSIFPFAIKRIFPCSFGNKRMHLLTRVYGN